MGELFNRLEDKADQSHDLNRGDQATLNNDGSDRGRYGDQITEEVGPKRCAVCTCRAEEGATLQSCDLSLLITVLQANDVHERGVVGWARCSGWLA